jgi:hypothetical protein
MELLLLFTIRAVHRHAGNLSVGERHHTEDIPEILLKAVGDPSMLVQGEWSVGE